MPERVVNDDGALRFEGVEHLAIDPCRFRAHSIAKPVDHFEPRVRSVAVAALVQTTLEAGAELRHRQ